MDDLMVMGGFEEADMDGINEYDCDDKLIKAAQKLAPSGATNSSSAIDGYQNPLDSSEQVVHKELGVVVPKGGGVFAKQVSLKEAFKNHMEAWDGVSMQASTKEEALELEKRKFLMLVAARVDQSKAIIDGIEGAKTKRELDVVYAAPKGTKLRSMTDMIRTHGGDGVFAETQKEADKLYAQMKKNGRVVKLPSGAVVLNKEMGRKVITREAAEKFREQGFNVGIRFDQSTDPYMNKLRDEARLAVAFTEGGFQMEGLDDGISASTPKDKVAKFRAGMDVAAHVISKYERELDVITRHDGDHEKLVRVDVESFYRHMTANGVPFKHINELQKLDPVIVGSEMARLEANFKELLLVLETLDCAVYVPRLCLFLCGQAMTRQVEFTRVYRVYLAAFGVLRQCIDLPTEKQARKQERAFDKKIKKMSKGGEKNVKKIERGTQHAWVNTRPTRKFINNALSELRKAARNGIMQNISDVASWYVNEKRYHANEMGDVERALFTPQYASETLEKVPTVLEIRYYQGLWNAIQNYCTELLRAYEGTILLMLQEYFPKEYNDYWCSVSKYPTEGHCHPLTVRELLNTNKVLTEWRTFDEDEFIGMNATSPMQAPVLDAGADELHVNPSQPWSPTFKQMKQYHENMYVLFRLSPSNLETVFRRKRNSSEQELRSVNEEAQKVRDDIDKDVLKSVERRRERDHRRRAYAKQKRKGK